jgi:hypothetical protein
MSNPGKKEIELDNSLLILADWKHRNHHQSRNIKVDGFKIIN